MHKTILIPTDFSIESLSLLKAATRENQASKLNVILVYGYNTPESISDLLFYSPTKIIDKLTTPDFREALSILQNRLSSSLLSVKILLFTGKTNSSFRSFLEVNNVDELIIPAKNMLNHPAASAKDLLPFFEKSKTAKLFVEWEARIIHPQEDRLAALFAV